METPYTVPEIARLTGIPETTLYDYVRQFAGVVPEIETAEENGRPRRRYPEQAIAVFQTIRHLKDRGVDLPTIRALLQEERPQGCLADSLSMSEAMELVEEVIAATLTDEAPATQETVVQPVAEESRLPTLEAPEAGETKNPLERIAPTPDEPAPAPDITIPRERPIGATLEERPFFEVPALEPKPVIPVTVQPVTPLEPAVVIHPEAPPVEPIAASVPSPFQIPDAFPTAPSLASVTAPPVVDAEIFAMQTQLLGSLEEGLQSLRALVGSQNSDNQRLEAELKEQQDENERLRATIRYQKEQARSAERLLATIKTQCEQGISVIGE
jgi:DNA-binding transcriptional MerR regulator